MSGHTPGPWIINEGGDSLYEEPLEVTTADREERLKAPIATVPVGYMGDHEDEQRANARLIAAAPDLLEALRAVLPHAAYLINDNHPAMKSARAAIAKATEAP